MHAAVAEAREFDIQAVDGRRIHVYEDGDPAGPLLIYHHGTPLSGLLPSMWAQVARDNGMRMVSIDRAGYGGSDRHPGRRIADVVADAAAVADACGADRLFVFGESGGGPYALGCAALLPTRVIAAVSMSGPAPFDAEGLDFIASMGQDNIDEFNAALAGEPTLRRYLSDQREALLAASSQTLHGVMDSLLSPADKAVFTGDLAGWIHAASNRAFGLATTDGSTTTRRSSGPGGSIQATSACRYSSSQASRTDSCRTPTHNGSSTTFPTQQMV